MSESGRRIPWKIILIATVIAAILFGGEMLVTLFVEFVELLVDVTHTAFMLLLEKVFGLPYEKAQGRAAWMSVGLLIALALFGAWRLTPWIKRVSGECRQSVHDARAALIDLWRSARWYQKLLYLAGGLIVLAMLLMVV
ncbi:hypothetical protein [Methylotetracoccus oryzae]|uniref:hypothetical protein n=1 Tax=Methylotetracoccus oryzae TaxID=1919059 RepID=UPI00111951DB|nr:hypothetical protein [Methylotetracoccus oryzae]